MLFQFVRVLFHKYCKKVTVQYSSLLIGLFPGIHAVTEIVNRGFTEDRPSTVSYPARPVKPCRDACNFPSLLINSPVGTNRKSHNFYKIFVLLSQESEKQEDVQGGEEDAGNL